MSPLGFGFDFTYLLYLGPPMLLMLWAQWRVKSNFAHGSRVSANLTGAAAARLILDRAGLNAVRIEPIAGQLSDHYDPRDKVLRLSEGVYGQRSAAAVGIAAHEAGHALQDATNYAPLVVRNFAVPLAGFGGKISSFALFAGLLLAFAGAFALGKVLLFAGILGLAAVLFFQVVNLPVEFDASNRAKRLVNELEMVDAEGGAAIRGVLNAAAWTYVAGMLTTAATLLYWLSRFSSLNRRD